jgi:hypothetical protein
MNGIEELKFQRGLMADRAAQWAEDCSAAMAKLKAAEERIVSLNAELTAVRTPSVPKANGHDAVHVAAEI